MEWDFFEYSSGSSYNRNESGDNLFHFDAGAFVGFDFDMNLSQFSREFNDTWDSTIQLWNDVMNEASYLFDYWKR